MQILLFLVCVVACLVGSISGLGGGIIIKPIIDILGIMEISTLNFLSGCTVLTMSIISIFRRRKEGINVDISIAIFLGIGSIIGGILGKQLFTFSKLIFQDNNKVGLIQSIMLFIINIYIYFFMKNKEIVNSKKLNNKIITSLIGVILGVVSTFLGIGGGALNIAVIYYFFSMTPKQTSGCSLIVILFSQASSFISTLISGVPEFKYMNLIIMCIGAVFGALIGGNIAKKMDNKKTQDFFMKLLIFLIMISIFNIFTIFIYIILIFVNIIYIKNCKYIYELSRFYNNNFI